MLAGRLSQVVTAASRRRDSLAVERQQHSAAMAAVREEVDALRTRIAALTEALHRDEVAKAEAALRIEGLEQMVLEQFGMAPDDLVAEYGPQVPLPPTELELVEYEQARERGEQVTPPAPMPFDRPTQERRPSAPNESWPSWAGSTRWRWRSTPRWRSATTFCPLSSKTSRPRARTCSTSSPTSTPASCRCLPRRSPTWNASFARCSPRCSRRGRPAAVDRSRRHAHHRHRSRGRPPGKKVKRLSLLSGGEKALTAVAMLVAIFRPAVAVLRHGRGGGGPGRREPAAAARAVRRIAGAIADHHHHASKTDHGGGRRALRRDHARRRHHHSDLAADARPAGGPARRQLTIARSTWCPTLYGSSSRVSPRWWSSLR
ncbi:putative sMC structural maintenance of chromosomes partitioning protein [Mycobacterium xenopi 3993]|nr:putative sMC structural maintenance of chromosomes partitioning protein [Mycobacterium xenopi 3993]